jgi:hypothetical protein
MYKILIVASIGIVFILSLRTNKEQKQLKILELNETEYRSNRGNETNYLPFTRSPEDKQCETSKVFDTY